MMAQVSSGSTQQASSPAPSASAKRETAFESAGRDAPQTQSGEVLLIEAYAAVWLILFFFIVSLWRRQNSIHERLERLDRSLDRMAELRSKKEAK